MGFMKYTDEMREFILANYKGISSQELAERFNDRFGTQLKAGQIKSYKKNHHLNSGLSGQFQKGHIPASKGKKMSKEQYEKCKATMFKKGEMPKQYKQVGTEVMRWQDRNHKKKIIWVKIADPNVWKEKHVLVWESHNGPVPKGKMLIFLDGDTLNTKIDNLRMIDKKTNLILNHEGLRYNNKECTEAGLMVTEIINQVNRRKRK